MNGGSSVEEQTTYHPEELGTLELAAGDPEQRWEEYALEIVPVLFDGKDHGQRAIMRNGEFVAMCTEEYRLLPNEHAVQTADQIADELGAVPFSDFSGDWFIKLNDHVFQDSEGRRAHALYAWDDPVDINGTGDEIQLGFAVHNSIDTSMGFKVGLFTFRHACANMVFMGVDRRGMNFDSRDVIEHYDQKHTSGLDVDNLRALVEDTVGYGSHVIDAYQAWTTREVDAQILEPLIRRAQSSALSKRKDIPGWLSDAIDSVEEAEERARENQRLDGTFVNGLPAEARAQIVEANVPQGETVWDTYNDLTENIWHNPDTKDNSKLRKMKNVHRSFELGSEEVSIV